MSEVGYRPAVRDDALALAEFQDEANEGHLRATTWNRLGEDWREVGAATIAGEVSEMSWRRTIVAYDADTVVGMLNYADNDEITQSPDPVAAPFVRLRQSLGSGLYLRAMAVRASHRGKGIAATLLDVAAAAAWENGSAMIGVIVHETNERLAAHYRSRGFVEVERARVLRHHSYPVGSDLVALRLDLKST